MSPRPPFLSVLRDAVAAVLLRPHLVLTFVAVHLLVAWVLVAPLRGLLHDELDGNLYGDKMATGASWRWFDTVTRKHGEAIGDLSIIHAFFSDEGVGLEDLATLSGPAAAVALAALFLFWVNSLLVTAFLGHLHPDRRGGFGAAMVRFALPASALTFFAALTYAAVYGLFYVRTGAWLAPWRESFDSQAAAILLTWIRLGVTAAVLLGVKILFDLARVVLVERNGWNWPWAFLVALRELVRHGGRYAALTLGVLGGGTVLLTLLWWPLGWLFRAPQGWLTLILAFAAQQALLGARIALRLGALGAIHHLYLATRDLEAEGQPPYKVEPAPEVA